MAFAAGAATGSTTEGVIDTINGNYCNVYIGLSSQGSATNKPAVLKLQHADTDDPTSYEDIPEMVGDDPAGFTIPDADTVNDQGLHLGIRMNGRKRFVKAVVSPQSTDQDISILGSVGEGNTDELHAKSALAHFA